MHVYANTMLFSVKKKVDKVILFHLTGIKYQ